MRAHIPIQSHSPTKAQVSLSTNYSITSVTSGAQGCNRNYKMKTIKHLTSVKNTRKFRFWNASQVLHAHSEGSVHWALQAANPTFDCHGLSCHRTRRESGNVSLQRRRQENIRSACCVPTHVWQRWRQHHSITASLASEHRQTAMVVTFRRWEILLVQIPQGMFSEHLYT